jgi:hypothetical protein
MTDGDDLFKELLGATLAVELLALIILMVLGLVYK